MNEMVPVAQPASDSGALMAIISRAATDPTLDVAKLQALLDVKKQWEADEARKAFVASLSAFKANPPAIAKNKRVRFESQKGVTDYLHATLDNVCDIIGAALAKHGLSFRWETAQSDTGAIKVTCVLMHVLGHAERVSLVGSPDQSGGKNAIQAVGSTVTYLQRYTLLAATGMATGEQDDDGRGAGKHAEQTPAADPWTPELRAAGKAAAERGTQAYADWWKGLHAEFRRVATKTQQHADYKALAEESQP